MNCKFAHITDPNGGGSSSYYASPSKSPIKLSASYASSSANSAAAARREADPHTAPVFDVRFIGTFGWNETADPSTTVEQSASALLSHFHSRLTLPGHPPYLRSAAAALPSSVDVIETDERKPTLRYERPPLECLLSAANHYTFDWLNNIDFVTPRRNLLAFIDGREEARVDVQRFPPPLTSTSAVEVAAAKRLPMFMRRVIDYESTEPGKASYQFERILRGQQSLTSGHSADGKTQPSTATTATSVVKADDQFRSVVQLTISTPPIKASTGLTLAAGKPLYRVLMSGEIDTVVAPPPASTVKADGKSATAPATSAPPLIQLKDVREVKTIWADTPKLWKERAPKTYLQSACSGTPLIIYGMKERNNNSRSKKEPLTLRIEMRDVETQIVPSATERAGLRVGLKEYLDWIKATVPEDGRVYRLDYHKRECLPSPLGLKDTILSIEMLQLLQPSTSTSTSTSTATAVKPAANAAATDSSVDAVTASVSVLSLNAQK